jgi:hypothetical protein
MKRLPLILAAAALAAACSDSAGPGTDPGVSLSFATSAPAAAAPGFFASVAADTLTDGANTLVITKAEIVLREIELERVEVTDCDVEPEPDGCEEFETGPMLLDLPLDGQTVTAVTVPVPPGMYDELEFEIHKVTRDEEDSVFAAAHPDLVDKSIRIQGSFNGQPFTYETDLDVEQEFDLTPPLVIDDATTATNVTVRLDLDAWFRDGAGDLVNPQDGNKGGQYESLIKENIKQNIEAFEDEDRDGDDSDES